MFEEKSVDRYCTYVFQELMDMKLRITEIEKYAGDLSPEDKRAVSNNILTLLDELTNKVDSTLQSVTAYCPAIKEKIKGASKWASEFHTTGSRS